MNKSALLRFIDKYTLGGEIKSVKWKSNGTSLSTRFISGDKSLVGNAILSRDIVNKYIFEVKNFPEDDKLSLEHLILSYQGRKEWQSPVEPQTLEAILLHSINFIDSKINFMRRDVP